MDFIRHMENAVAYIEENLMGKIDINEAARAACCSAYNLQRIFSYLTDISLSEYIRKRRLSLAALELQTANSRIADLALQYGYESPAAFSRAFTQFHGISPSDAGKSGATVKSYPRISFQLVVKGAYAMNYRLEHKEAFEVFGIETVASLTEEKAGLSPAELWQECRKDGRYEKLFSDSGTLPGFLPQDLCKIHGMVNYRNTGSNTFPYLLFAFRSEDSNTEGYQVVQVPAQTYAVFPSEHFSWDEDFGAVLETLKRRFYTEWLPSSQYEKAEGPEFEIYGGTTEYGYLELWFPVVKK